MSVSMVLLVIYTITGISYTELVSWVLNRIEGKHLNWIQKMFIFSIWPVLVIVSIIMHINSKK